MRQLLRNATFITKFVRIICKIHIKIPSIKPSGKSYVGQININPIRNKFDILKPMLTEALEILMIIETKLDDSFTEAQFQIESFTTPFRLYRNSHGGRVLLR